MDRLNHCAIYDVDVGVHHSEIPFESNSESVPDTYTTLIKSITTSFTSIVKYDDDLSGVYIHMLQD